MKLTYTTANKRITAEFEADTHRELFAQIAKGGKDKVQGNTSAPSEKKMYRDLRDDSAPHQQVRPAFNFQSKRLLDGPFL